MCIEIHLPRNWALGQVWQKSVIILALAPAHALPLIHFTASPLTPEGKPDHVGESTIWREVSLFVILLIPSSFPFLSPLALILCSHMVYQNEQWHY